MTFRLSQHWKDKIRTREMINRGMDTVSPKAHLKQNYRVKWDHPDWDKGEKVEEKTFHDLDEAKKYGAWVARNYDLRREGKDENSIDVRTGYNPAPEPSSVVPVAIETPFGLLELTEVDVFGEQAGTWTLVDALMKSGERSKVEDNFRAG